LTEVEFYRPCTLDLNKHRRDEFCCGNAALDAWLRKYPGQSRRGNTAASWVIADDQYRVAAYATLSMTSLDRAACPEKLAKGAPTAIPALLIGRLGTSASLAGLGLGTQLVRHVLATAVELNDKAACRAVVVTALNSGVYGWWQRFGFVPFDPADDTSLDLYLLTSDIRRTIEQW
jgi:GNAT superfamily N-acetyltransferase